MSWLTDKEQVLRSIIDRNCTLVGTMTDGCGKRCFWGTYLVEEMEYVEELSELGTYCRLISPEGLTMEFLPDDALIGCPPGFISSMMSANDDNHTLKPRRRALRLKLREWMETEA